MANLQKTHAPLVIIWLCASFFQGMGSRDNPNYLVKQSNAEPPPPQLPNDDVYDFVQPQRSQASASQPSVYEVPPSMTLPCRGNGQVATDATAARSSRGQPSDCYENTSILSSTQGKQQAEIRRKYDYDLVSFPARKATLERPAYDTVPPPNQVPQVSFRGVLTLTESVTPILLLGLRPVFAQGRWHANYSRIR